MAAHSSHRSSGTAAVAAVLLLGLGLATAWWALAPSILGVSQAAPLQGERVELAAAAPAPAALAEGIRLTNSIQVTPPRDPFLPLVNANTGSGSFTGGSGSTATIRTSFTLGTVKDVSGVLRADVTIDGVEKRLGPGDSFYIEPNLDHGAVCRKAGVLLDVFSPVRDDFLEEDEA